MFFKKKKDQILRKNYIKNEKKNKIFKFIKINLFYKTILRKSVIQEILNQKQLKTISKVKMINYCLLNKRSKTSYKPFNLSRSIFRELIQFGIIPGYKKAVW